MTPPMPLPADDSLAKFTKDVNALYDRNAIRVLLQGAGQAASVQIPPRPFIMGQVAQMMTNSEKEKG